MMMSPATPNSFLVMFRAVLGYVASFPISEAIFG